MTAFADSSALVKLYADEDGHADIRARDLYVISAIARVEVPSALWRKHRLGELSLDACALLVRGFEADLSSGAAGTELIAVALTDEVLESAAALTAVYALRAYDAVQLACARAARDADPAVSVFACFDADLSAAATTERFSPLH